MSKLGLTKRIVRRKPPLRFCKCGTQIGAKDHGFHLDAEATGKCALCYQHYIEEIFTKYGKICACCHFGREPTGRGGTMFCLKSRSKAGRDKPWLKDSRFKRLSHTCMKWRKKKVEAC